MRDAEILLLILAGVYMAECTRWLRYDVVAFWSPLAKKCRLTWPGRLFGNAQGGLVVGFSLPPLGRMFLCPSWTVSLSPEGVYGYVAQSLNPGGRPPATQGWFLWDEVENVEFDSHSVFVNGKLLTRTALAPQAETLAALLGRMAKLPAERRASALDQALLAMTDAPAVERLLDQYLRHTWSLQMTANWLFLWVFVGGALLVWWPGFWRSWPALVVGLLLLLIAAIVQYFMAQRALFPDARADRWKHVALMALSPPAAMRAHDTVARDLLVGHEPLTVGRMLMSTSDFRDFARRVLLDLQHPLPSNQPDDETPLKIETWFRARQKELAVATVRDAGLDAAELLAPPTAEASNCRSYCPRCHLQYTVGEGECTVCSGISLISFPDRLGSAPQPA